MGVFGTSGQSKFESNGTEVLIPNNIIMQFKTEIIERQLEDKGTGEIYIDHVGERLIYKCKSYIGEERKYIAEFNRLYQYRNLNVYLAPFSEGEYLKGENGSRILCHVNISWGYLKTRNFYDVLNFTFRSLKKIDLSKLVLPENVRISPDGMVRIDPDTGKARIGD